MSKKKIIVSVVAIVVLFLGMGIFGYVIYSPKKSVVPASAVSRYMNITPPVSNPQSNDEVGGSVLYKDESGFSFRHPRKVSVVDKTPNDNLYYTFLNINKGNETMTIVMKDTNYKKIANWRLDQKKTPSLIGALSLDGVAAEQYLVDDKLITVAVDQGVLYVIESPRDVSFWDKVHEIFVDSFAFDASEIDSEILDVDTALDGGKVIYEPEEIIQ